MAAPLPLFAATVVAALMAATLLKNALMAAFPGAAASVVAPLVASTLLTHLKKLEKINNMYKDLTPCVFPLLVSALSSFRTGDLKSCPPDLEFSALTKG